MIRPVHPRRTSALPLLLVVALVACGESAPGGRSAPGAPTTPSPEADGGMRSSGPPAAPSGGAPDAPTGHDDGGASPEEAAVPYTHFDVNHVLSTGQSNAVAIDAFPVLSTTQPFHNLMFDVGVMTATACDKNGCNGYAKPSAFVPLVEGDTFFSPIETMSSGMANHAAKRAQEGVPGAGPVDHSMLVSLHGRSGNGYYCLRKGGCPEWWPGNAYVNPFEEGMRQVDDAMRLAQAAGKTYVVRAVTTVHGEHDHYAYSSNDSIFPIPRTDGDGVVADYGDALLEWQRDYESSVQARTGQALPVPLLLNQYSHWNDVPTTKIAYQQLAAHVASKGKVVIVGPTYQLPYTEDCLHFTGRGERWLGEYFGKAYARIVFEGRRWEPLRPIQFDRSGASIVVRYAVPKPPLVLDTEHVTNPGDFGFEAVDATGARVPVASVTIAGADSVAVTFPTPETAAAVTRLRYAYTFTGCGGSGTVARGNVRDSDSTAPVAGEDPLWNWSVHFDEPVP